MATQKTLAQIEAEIKETMRKWYVPHYTLNIRVERKAVKRPCMVSGDRAVSISFMLRGNAMALTIGRKEHPIDNLALLATALETARLAEVREIGEAVGKLLGYIHPAARPDERPRQASAGSPYAVLFISPNAPLVVAEAAYRALSKAAHPDAGGSHERMKALNAAIAAVRTTAK